MNDRLSMDVDAYRGDGGFEDGRSPARRKRVKRGLPLEIVRWDKIERAKRETVRAERLDGSDRWRVICSWRVGSETRLHTSMAVFRSSAEAVNGGEHFLALLWRRGERHL